MRSKEEKEEVKGEFSYCQSEIEGKEMCLFQCDHCKEYYKPLEDKN